MQETHWAQTQKIVGRWEIRQFRSVLLSQSERRHALPCIKRLFSDTAVHHWATKSVSDRRHGSPRRTVRIRLDMGRRFRIGDCLKVPAYVRPSSICRTSHRVAGTFIAEAGLSDRVSTLAADDLAAPQPVTSTPRGEVDEGGSVVGIIRDPLRHVAHSMDLDAFSSLKAFSTFRADRHRCMLVLRRRRKSEHCVCARTGIASAEWLRVTSRSQYQCSIGARHPP